MVSKGNAGRAAIQEGDAVITLAEYFGDKAHTDEHAVNAVELLRRVGTLLDKYGRMPPFNPKRGDQISGNRGGDGGFRLPDSQTGVAKSSHKEGKAVDIYDPGNDLDSWITDSILTSVDLYREHPDSTAQWVHLTTRPPGSGKRTFFP